MDPVTSLIRGSAPNTPPPPTPRVWNIFFWPPAKGQTCLCSDLRGAVKKKAFKSNSLSNSNWTEMDDVFHRALQAQRTSISFWFIFKQRDIHTSVRVCLTWSCFDLCPSPADCYLRAWSETKLWGGRNSDTRQRVDSQSGIFCLYCVLTGAEAGRK